MRPSPDELGILAQGGPGLPRLPSLPRPGCPRWGRQAPGSRPSVVGGTGGAGRRTRESGSRLTGGGLGGEGCRDAPGRRGSASRHSVVRGWWTRTSSLRRTGPQTKRVDVPGAAQGSPAGVVTTGIVPAPAVHRRVADVFIFPPADLGRKGTSGGHLPPQEPAELAGHGGGHHGLHVLAGRQGPEPGAQAALGGPGPGHRLRGAPLLAPAKARSHRRAVLVGPR